MTKSMLHLVALLLAALGSAQAGDSPFSSQAEKTFLLETAGLDGQIAAHEWRADRPFFQDLDWERLIGYDHDGDGMISLNEFLRFVKHSPAAGTVPDETATLQPMNLAYSVAQRGPGIPDRRMLFQKAKVALRTKFMKPLNPDVDFIAERNRAEHLKTISDKRRFAAAQRTLAPNEESRRLRDLYRSRLVKNRFSETSPAESGIRSTFKASRRPAGAEEGPSWRRSLLNDRLQRGSSPDRTDEGAPANPPSESKRDNAEKSRTREASNIRSLIPRSNATGSKAREEIKEVERKR